MNKFNNKAYTLIELLAVILMLAIISLIAVPIVTTIVEESRKGSFKTSVMNSFKAVDTYLFFDGEVEMPELGVNIKDIDTLKPNNFKSGLIFKNLNGNYEVSDVSDGRYCANGELENLVITKGSCDFNPPELVIVKDETNVTLNMTDDKELTGYVCTNTDETPTSWISISGKTATGTCNFTELGTYYGWVKDSSNNITKKNIEIINSDFCSFNPGQTWVYNYTGGSQSFITPCNGVYKLEVYGAQGGSWATCTGGLGGYSKGQLTLSETTPLYVVVGGAGTEYSSMYQVTGTNGGGGYNGGGNATFRENDSNAMYAGGGGATHIGYMSGTLSSIGYTNAITNGKVLIVAGGGGGVGMTSVTGYNGGAGSGSVGQNGFGSYAGTGATTTSGGVNSYYNNSYTIGLFGQAQYLRNSSGTVISHASGGGGGLYGGGPSYGKTSSGGGGSGYLSPSLAITETGTGLKTGHGQAIITLLSYY